MSTEDNDKKSEEVPVVDGLTFKDQTDAKINQSEWTTTRKELFSYYLYYIGNNGLSGFNYGPSQFQNLLFLAGYDPSQPPFTMPCGDGDCVLPYLGSLES